MSLASPLRKDLFSLTLDFYPAILNLLFHLYLVQSHSYTPFLFFSAPISCKFPLAVLIPEILDTLFMSAWSCQALLFFRINLAVKHQIISVQYLDKFIFYS